VVQDQKDQRARKRQKNDQNWVLEKLLETFAPPLNRHI
jgi:hypothetical protein